MFKIKKCTCATLFLFSMSLPLLAEEVKNNKTKNNNCENKFTLGCITHGGRQAGNKIGNLFKGPTQRVAEDEQLKDLTVDEVYHAPLIRPGQQVDPSMEIEKRNLEAEQYIEVGKWYKAETLISKEENLELKKQLQLSYVRGMARAGLNAKANSYIDEEMSDPYFVSEAKMHVVKSEINFGDLDRARLVALTIPSELIRIDAVKLVDDSSSGYAAIARGLRNRTLYKNGDPNSGLSALLRGMGYLNDSFNTIGDNIYVQRLNVDAHALTLSKNSHDRIAYEKSKDASARGEMLEALDAATVIKNRAFKRKVLERLINDPKINKNLRGLY
jgi:hypothetical protein